jgi:hypothetical protein
MKKTLCSVTILFLIISALSAQSKDTPNDTPTLPTEGYPIGSSSKPILAAEYCTCLSEISAPQKELSLDTVQQNYIGIDNPIVCDGSPGDVQFSIILEKDMHQVIATVPSQNAQTLFNLWHQNPTIIDAIDYLNAKYHTQWKNCSPSSLGVYSQVVSKLSSAYPNSTTLSIADRIASFPGRTDSYDFLNDRNNIVFSITSQNIKGGLEAWILLLKKQNPECYNRPNVIARNGTPMTQ